MLGNGNFGSFLKKTFLFLHNSLMFRKEFSIQTIKLQFHFRYWMVLSFSKVNVPVKMTIELNASHKVDLSVRRPSIQYSSVRLDFLYDGCLDFFPSPNIR